MTAKIVFGGGCFWCTETIFLEVDGVIAVRSGYSGGNIKNPAYREVCTGRTGHAEVIEVTYNDEIVSYKDLVALHLVTHDPTTLNAQGADRGTQYRSIIFYNNEQEKEIALTTIKEIQEGYSNAIVTEVAPFEVFYEAEQEHQDFYKNNPDYGYCRVVIEPKLQKFRELYSKL